MTSELRDAYASRRKVDLEEAIALREHDEKKWSFTKLGQRYGVSRQAVANMFRNHGLADPEKPKWPWTIRRDHMRANSTYEQFLATRKMLEGRELTSRERNQAKAVLAFARRIDGVITYDYDNGWAWTSRRDEDGDELFVKR